MKKDIIEALLYGKNVQYKTYRNIHDVIGSWVDLEGSKKYPKLYADLFLDDSTIEWRIKKESIKLPTKLALMENGDGYFCAVAINEKEVLDLERNTKYFKHWLTDWITYEI